MGHITARRKVEASGIRSTIEWLGVGANIADFANARAKRNDIVVAISSATTAGAAALFVPGTAELEISHAECFEPGVTPEMVGDIAERSTRLEHPTASGVILHETAHARWTVWSLQDAVTVGKADKKHGMLVTEAMHWLEESRIEHHAVEAWPRDREQLRSSALHLALSDSSDSGDEDLALATPVQLLRLACLSEARAVGGVVDPEDIETITGALESGLGAERLQSAREIFAKVHEFDSDSVHLFDNMHAAALELLDLLTDDEIEEQHNAQESGDGEFGGIVGAVMDALSEAADATEVDARTAVAEQIKDDRDAEEAKAAAEAKAEADKSRITAEKVFESHGPSPRDATSSYEYETRPPVAAERAAAVRMGRDLERINYRERSVVKSTSVMPPGRLRARTAVLGAAQRAQGIAVTAEPWGAKHRKHTDSAPLTAGVMVDISGSMSSAMEPMASTAWVLSEAVKRVQGTAAMVYYGDSVFATLKPHQHLDKVTVYTAPDGSEKFNQAARAIDGALNLTNGTGARVLFIVSDGCYSGLEPEAARRWVKRFTDAGVAIVWIPMTKEGRDVSSWSVLRDANVSDYVSIVHGRDSGTIMREVGRAVVDTFRKAQRQ